MGIGGNSIRFSIWIFFILFLQTVLFSFFVLFVISPTQLAICALVSILSSIVIDLCLGSGRLDAETRHRELTKSWGFIDPHISDLKTTLVFWVSSLIILIIMLFTSSELGYFFKFEIFTFVSYLSCFLIIISRLKIAGLFG